MDKEIAAGTRFENRPDPEDPRFDLISIRMPNASFAQGPNAPTVEACALTGVAARWKLARFVVATAGGIADQYGVPQLQDLLRALWHEVRVQEISAPREDAVKKREDKQTAIRPKVE
jgi:hypothetical protein